MLPGLRSSHKEQEIVHILLQCPSTSTRTGERWRSSRRNSDRTELKLTGQRTIVEQRPTWCTK